MKKILIVLGTRPEGIKLAPVIQELLKCSTFETRVCITAQHRSMLDQVLSIFQIAPDFDLDLMSQSQTLQGISAKILEHISAVLDRFRPDLVIVHGDTTTAAMASLASFYQRIPVAHVEAGLRTWDLYSPWPEELNRRIIGIISSIHFTPTDISKENLLKDNVRLDDIHVTGNTVIDALFQAASLLENDDGLRKPLEARFSFLDSEKKLLLVTGHRRENFGSGLEEICDALLILSQRPDVQIIYAVHLNPNVKEIVQRKLNDRANIFLVPPQDYLSFVFLMSRCSIILTDSGGIQEEAPSLGKPVLVMRETTERPEAINAGTAKLVGANTNKIVSAVESLLTSEMEYQLMSTRINPYGDGKAAKRIAAKIKAYLENIK